jgi:hypothetical protein
VDSRQRGHFQRGIRGIRGRIRGTIKARTRGTEDKGG